MPTAAPQATVIKRTNEFQTGRDHVVMVPGILDLSPNGSRWPEGLTIKLPASIIGTTNESRVTCGYAQPLLVLPGNASAGHMQIRQLQLAGLPQGPSEEQQQHRHRRLLAEDGGSTVPSEWTLLFWFIKR